MKFGLCLHRFLIPKWDAYYIDYNGLCQIVRDLARTCDSTAAFRHINENVSRFNMFRLKISESAARRENEICRIFGFPTAPVTLPNIGSVDGLELQVVRVMYEDLLLELREIQWFDKVNHTAMEKLFGKLANYRHDKIAFERCYSRWVTLQRGLDKSLAELLGRVDKLVSEIRKESTQSRLGTHSWCIAGRVSHTPPATDMHDMIYKFLKNDQHSLVKEHVLSSGAPEVTTGDNIGLFVGDLFLISIIFSAKYTKALTLEIIPCEQVSAEHFFLIVKIYGIEFQRHLSQSQNFQTEHLEHAAHEFTKLLNASGSKATDLLQEKDSGGCLLLHHAAHYGLDSLCKVIICHLINTSPTLAAETLISTDHYGRTPFHYAVDGGNLPILTLLLNALSDIILDKQLKSRVRAILGDILILALRAGTDEMAKIVLEHGPDLLHRSSRGETALYVAVQFGNLPLARLLTSQLSGYELSLEAVEQTRGWTPLMVACANGHTLITKLLLHAGAKQSPCDARGWTALEHAVFRGHHVVAELFKPCQPSTDLDGPAIATRAAHKTSHTVCSADQKMLIVHLGSTQGGHDRAAIQLEGSDPNDIYTFPQEYPLEMQISVLGTPSVAKTIQLPPLEDQLHKPLIFRVEHGVPLQIVLKICRRGVGSSETLVCSGTSLLDQESVLGDKHESLIRERTVYMVDKEKSGPAGSVLLSYVIAESFSGLEKPSASSCPRSEEGLVRLVGHRGLGQNVPSRSFLQLGENTVMSFLSAAKFGASFVEFDLQVTSDLEAVIYHDFSLSESGTNIPVHDLTLAQYKHASDVQEPRSNVDNSIQPLLAGQRKPRAWSSGEESVSQAAQLRRRLQCTVDFQTKGFKPNSRGDVVQDSLTTLEELLVKLPLEIGFNIEIKYPRLHEATEAGVAPVALNINTFIDVALKKLQGLAGKRPIILSSFTPEVCILLSVKQSAYPVMFITNAGRAPMQDKELRASSLQAAVHFARIWNLAGIVFACETLLYCPRLVRFVKNMGLICASYGLLNNEPTNAKMQVAAGVDFLMVDRVKLIADHLSVALST